MWAGVEYKNEPFVDSFSLVCLTIWKKANLGRTGLSNSLFERVLTVLWVD